jgi:hypothetical protein
MQVTISYINTWEYFTSIELNEKNGQLGNLDVSLQDILTTMHATLGLFKFLTNLILGKFEKLAQLVVPTIISHARSIGEPHCIIGQSSKLALK